METRRNAPPALAGSTLLVGGTSLASRVLGFVRDMLMAWLLGGGPAADALVLALRLPHALRRLLSEGSLSMTLTACLVHRQTQASIPHAENAISDTSKIHPGTAASFALAWAVSLRIALFLGLLILLAEMAARPLIDVLAPGLSAQAGPSTAAEAASLLRICLPYAFAAGMAALAMAFLHSIGHFLLPALSPICFNAVIITFAMLAFCGVGSPTIMLAYGFLAGGLMQWLLPCLALWRMRFWQYRTPPPPHSTVRACLRSLPAGLLGAAAPQLALLCAMGAASFLPSGSMAALYYAERLLELPMSISGTALGMVSLPALSALYAQQRYQAFADYCNMTLRLSLLLALPAAAGLLAIGQPLIETLLRHGAFDSQAVHNTTLALYGYAVGLPLYALSRPLLAACNACKRTRFSAQSGLCAVLGTLGAAFALLHLLPSTHAVLGPPLAVGFGLAVQCCLLWRMLGQEMRRAADAPIQGIRLPLFSLCSMLLGSFAAFGAARLTANALTDPIGALAAAITAGVAAYAACLLLCGHEDTKTSIRWCKKFFAAKKEKGNSL